MQRRIAELKRGRFDVLVVGAGITGAWIALDCAARGLSVAVIDKGDVGGGTSSKSSKLIHGGIRYLQQLRFDKVRESAVERACYHRAAPHLSHFLPFIVPTYRRWGRGRWIMNAGMTLYRLLCAGADRYADPAKAVPPPYHLDRARTLERLPLADASLTGALVYCESHMESSERMTLAVLASAARMGAVCANYVAATAPLLDTRKRVNGVVAEDIEAGGGFEIRARITVNATGPWAALFNRALFGAGAMVAATGYCRGSHLVTRQLIPEYAVALPTRYAGRNIIDRGGRHVFILPWRGRSLIGTSYVATTDIDDPAVNREEIDQLVGEIKAQLPSLELSERDIVHAFSGIYPLMHPTPNDKTYQATGDYQIVDHAPQGYEGIISAVGAKFTTARRVAEKTTDLATGKLDAKTKPCRTRGLRLFGAQYDDLDGYIRDKTRALSSRLGEDQVRRLIRQYGAGIDRLMEHMDRDPGLAQPLCGSRPNLAAEVHHAVESEMAVRLDDVLYRRTGVGTIGFPDPECIERCAAIMAGLLGWDEARRAREVDALKRYRRHVDL